MILDLIIYIWKLLDTEHKQYEYNRKENFNLKLRIYFMEENKGKQLFIKKLEYHGILFIFNF